jgi:DNA-binding transcriptional LysR family regulator
MLDLARLRIFRAVARQGSFTRAAEQLYLAQPTVSQQVQVLERELGTPLLLRLGRRVELTPAGALLLDYADRLLELAEEAVVAVAAAAGTAARTLQLGAGNTLATYVLPDLLRRLQWERPEITIQIQVGNTEELLELLERGRLELALVGMPAGHQHLIAEPFLHDELVVIVAPDDPLAQRSSIELRGLESQTLFVREHGSALQAATATLLISARVEPARRVELANLEAIKRSVEAGLGVAIVPALAVGREIAAGTLRTIRLASPPPPRSFVAAWHRDRSLSPAAQAFLQVLRRPLGPGEGRGTRGEARDEGVPGS